MVILESKTGFPITEKARKDLRDDVNGVFESWDKLLELKKVRAVATAEMEAIAEAERKEREYLEKKKKEEEKRKEEGGAVGADVA